MSKAIPLRAERRWIETGPTALRYDVVSLPTGKAVRAAARSLTQRTGWDSGVYILVKCPAAMSPRSVVRAALTLELEVLYIGLSETNWEVRLAMLACGLSGGALRHDAAKGVAEADPAIERSELRLILISFSPAFSLERFLLEEFGRLTGHYPLLNRSRATRSSARVRKKGVAISWAALLEARQRR
jgi:hypothetical protein